MRKGKLKQIKLAKETLWKLTGGSPPTNNPSPSTAGCSPQRMTPTCDNVVCFY
jgi:hypothetical protein